MVIAHDGVRSAACGAARIPAGKPGEGRRKTARGELAHLGRLDGCLRSVHQSCSVPSLTGAHCSHISDNFVRRMGSRGGTPLVGGVGAKSPHRYPLPGFKGGGPRRTPCVASRYFASMSHTLRTRRFFASPRRQRTRFSPGSMEKKLSLRSISASSLSMQTLPA